MGGVGFLVSLAGAFLAGFSCHKDLVETRGDDLVPRNSYILKSQLAAAIATDPVLRDHYMPREKVNKEYVARAVVDSQYVPKSQLESAPIADKPSSENSGDGSRVSVLTAIHQEDSQESRGFTVSELACSRSGETVTCHFKVTADERGGYVELLTGPYTAGKSQAVDERGNGYDAAGGSLGGRSVSYDIPQGVPIRGTLVFRGIPRDVVVFNVVRIGSSAFMVEFHRVVIAA